MARDSLIKFAEEMKAAREEKDISLQQISTRTKIDLKYLKAIEDADFDIMPEVYMRAFIKEYAASVGLNKETVMKKYDKAKTGKLDASEHLDEPEEEPAPEKPSEKKDENFKEFAPPAPSSAPEITSKKGDNIKYIIGGVLLIIIILVVYFAFIREGSPEFVKENPYEESVQEPEQKYQVIGEDEEGDTTAAETPSAAAGGFELRLTAADTSWVGVEYGNGEKTEFMLFPGNSNTLNVEKSVVLTLGNSGGITLYRNGNKLDFTGRSGSVRKIRIDKNSIEPAGR